MAVWNAGLKTLLEEFWNEGIPASQIGKRLGTTKSAVIGKANRMGLKPRFNGVPSAHRVDDMVALYATGLSIPKVAREIGCSHATVWMHLKASGVKRRPSGWPKMARGRI